MDSDTGHALLGGLIAGAAGAFATTVVVLRMLAGSPAWLQRAGEQRLSPALLGIVAANGLLLAWAATGLILGAAYLRAESERPADGLGSPNRMFTLAVIVVVGSLLGLGAITHGRVTAAMAQTAAIAVLAFGWALPLLAAAG
jgi:hypothetical protein